MALRQWFDRMRQKKQLASDYGMDMDAQELASKARMSNEEVQYNALMKKRQNEYYKKVLRAEHKRKQHELWHRDIVSQPYIFKDRHEILKGRVKGHS